MEIYQCEDSLEGIFTAIYKVYEDRVDRTQVRLSLSNEVMLFSHIREVEPDAVCTGKVANTLLTRFGYTDYEEICLALSSPDGEKAQAVFGTIRQGLDKRIAPGHLLDNLADDAVNKAFKLARGASRELCHLRGFVRFEEQENNILYSKIQPKNNLITFLMPHFADRLPMENFVIFDEGRGIFGVHPSGKDWYLMQGEEPISQPSAAEMIYSELFRHFCDKIAIRERKNLALQRNLLPLRFRDYMTEFAAKG